MRFSRKLKTWLNASVRGMMPSFGKPKTPADELAILKKQLEAMEKEERKLAEQLKDVRSQAEAAREAGDAATAAAKEHLATELSAQLDTQSVRAITLEENVAVLTQSLQKNTAAAPQESAPPTESSTTDEASSPPPAATRNDDLSARKSRLSD